MTITTLLSSISIVFLPLGASVEGYKCGDIGGLYYNAENIQEPTIYFNDLSLHISNQNKDLYEQDVFS